MISSSESISNMRLSSSELTSRLQNAIEPTIDRLSRNEIIGFLGISGSYLRELTRELSQLNLPWFNYTRHSKSYNRSTALTLIAYKWLTEVSSRVEAAEQIYQFMEQYYDRQQGTETTGNCREERAEEREVYQC